MRFRFSVYHMMAQLIFSRVISPCSKTKTVSAVFPHLYNSFPISEDQVYDGLAFIGESYKKYIELFNHCYEQYYPRDFSHAFFDCTNYYFEIDLPCEDKQKGPSKENRHRISGKTVQVADKGLNCARNIYAAVKEAADGYIFSKSIHGRNLSAKEKEWLTLENDQNVWTDYTDRDGNLLYRLKSCVDTFPYRFQGPNPETGKVAVTTFSVAEKRIVSYNPALAKKQKAEIRKLADKASNYATYKDMTRATAALPLMVPPPLSTALPASLPTATSYPEAIPRKAFTVFM